ncbi:MAG: ABC transporter ATP-binding protein [Candidatus Poribacteria bacterium]|nr:MAG: ABC transporter ATP-binding protein [Candidatus Poribacteria bacterium]
MRGFTHRISRELDRPEPSRPVSYRKTYFRLLSYAKPYLPAVTLVLLFSLASSFLGVLPAQVMGVAIDEITGHGQIGIREQPTRSAAPSAEAGEEAVPRPPRRPQLFVAPYIARFAEIVSVRWLGSFPPVIATALVIVFAFLVLFLLSQLVGITQRILLAKIGQSLIYDMRGQVYAHLQRLSPRYFEDRPTGDTMSRVINDVNSLEQVLVGPIVELVGNVTRLVFVLYFCLIWDWQLTLLALVAVPLLVASTATIGRILRENFRIARQKIGELNTILQDNISGIRVIQAFAREDYELARFNQKSRENYEISVKIATIFALFRPWIEFLNQIGMLVVLGVGSVRVMRGQMNPGMLVVFFQYLPMLFGPISGFTRFYNTIQRALASAERVFEVLDTQPEIVSPPNAIVLTRVRGEVEFRHVHFAYRPGVEVLHDINLHADPGEMVALVGPSGAGKSTLVQLIPRFYDPIKGEILIDGHPLTQLELTALRRQIAIVPQDPFLFNVSVKENIRYGRLEATDEEIVAAAKAANAHEFIEQLPEGYDTLIGERGVKLSGGQRQRLAIARAILTDAPILILDEATSSVDSETERLIQEAIDRLVQNRTTFVIAHRLSTVQHADQILVMEAGRIVERGTHESLLALGGLYARLHEIQFRTDATGSPPRTSPPAQVPFRDREEEPPFSLDLDSIS